MIEITIYTQAQPLTVKEYQGERVITFKDVDTLHQRSEGTARRNFNANRGRFIEGEDFFVRNSYEAKEEFGVAAPNGSVLLTKMGYLMLVKSFTEVSKQNPAPNDTPQNPLFRVRTLPQAVKELREADPHSCITLSTLRRWVKLGIVPSRKTGKNFLVDLNEVERFMGEE